VAIAASCSSPSTAEAVVAEGDAIRTGNDIQAVRGSILHFLRDPGEAASAPAYEFFEDGGLVVRDGKVVAVGPASTVLANISPRRIADYSGKLILPGFIDTHIHYPQTEMVGAFGEELLQWLNKYTFPTERQFANQNYAEAVSKVFLDELLRAGTTSALVFSTVHKQSVDALMGEAYKRNMRIISGKVLMDRNAPDYLLDTPETAYSDSKELIDRWHKKGRLLYAITPRFAPTSTPAQLRSAKRLVDECPDCYVHTHVSENKGEVAWVNELFKNDVREGTSYLGVYDAFGLMTRRAVFAHGVHLSDADFSLLKDRDSAVSFCPTSNMFLGSGLFPYDKAHGMGVKIGLGTDIGAGTSFSQLHTLNEAYKVVKLQGGKLSGLQGLYAATLGSAKALDLESKIGNFERGKEADFVVLDPASTPLVKFRMERAKTPQEKLFVLMTMGDDRSVKATYVAGKLAHDRDEANKAFADGANTK
jgi:guanine deaminase